MSGKGGIVEFGVNGGKGDNKSRLQCEWHVQRHLDKTDNMLEPT